MCRYRASLLVAMVKVSKITELQYFDCYSKIFQRSNDFNPIESDVYFEHLRLGGRDGPFCHMLIYILRYSGNASQKSPSISLQATMGSNLGEVHFGILKNHLESLEIIWNP